MAQGLPPGLRGWFAADEAARQQNASQLQQLQGILAMQGMLQQQARGQQQDTREQAFRGALSGLPSNASPDDVLGAARPYASPDRLMSVIQSSQDRLAQRESALSIAQERIAAQIEAARQRGVDQRGLMEMQIQGRRDLAQLASGLRQPSAPTVTEVADPTDPTKSIKIDARTGAKIGDAPPKPKPERAVPSPLQKQLTEGAELADATKRFATTFKDDFAGKTITGELGNTYGKIMGDDTGQTQWWQDYELHQSQIRNKLFGSALTAPEIEAWNKSAINPRMDAKQVKANLTRRNMLEQRGIDRLMKGAIAGGYNKEQIEAFTGRSTTTDTTTQPKQPQDPLGIR